MILAQLTENEANGIVIALVVAACVAAALALESYLKRRDDDNDGPGPFAFC